MVVFDGLADHLHLSAQNVTNKTDQPNPAFTRLDDQLSI